MRTLTLIALAALVASPTSMAQNVHPADGSPNGGSMVTAEEIHKELAYNGVDPTKLTTIQMMGGLYASGYVLGVADSFNNDVICIPAGVSKQEIFAVVGKYLNEHPSGWHNPAPVEISVALHISYPCKAG